MRGRLPGWHYNVKPKPKKMKTLVCTECHQTYEVEARRASTRKYCLDCSPGRKVYDGNYGAFSDLPDDEIERRMRYAEIETRRRSLSEDWMSQVATASRPRD